MAKKTNEVVALACTECKSRNYTTFKPKNLEQGKKLTVKKFCPKCGKHTEHVETKLKK